MFGVAFGGNGGGEVVAPDDYLAFYPLESNSLDSSVNGHDGTDTSITYDGVSALVGTPNGRIVTSSITGTFTGFSQTVWVKFPSGCDRMYFTRANSNIFMYLGASVGAYIQSIMNGATICTEPNNTVPLDNAFHHVRFTWGKDVNSGFMRVHIDNVEISLGTSNAKLTDFVITTFGELIWNNGSPAFYVANNRLYGRALTDEEGTAIYDLEKTKFGL